MSMSRLASAGGIAARRALHNLRRVHTGCEIDAAKKANRPLMPKDHAEKEEIAKRANKYDAPPEKIVVYDAKARWTSNANVFFASMALGIYEYINWERTQ